MKIKTIRICILLVVLSFVHISNAQYFGGEGDGYCSDENFGLIVSVESDYYSVIKTYELSQNYPNPFNPKTTIRFTLPELSRVKLIIYNMLGKEISVLVDDIVQAGEHHVEFDAKDLPSGIYFYCIKAKDFTKTMRLAIIK